MHASSPLGAMCRDCGAIAQNAGAAKRSEHAPTMANGGGNDTLRADAHH
jgi:hypothetical protein